MKYIVTRRFCDNTLSGKYANIPAMTEAEEIDQIIYVNNLSICFNTSQNAYEHFARNDDGQGMKRGALTYAIAFSSRERFNTDHSRKQRFTDKEIELLESKWSKYLRQGLDAILFNDDFFNAEISELEKIAKDLNIKVKE